MKARNNPNDEQRMRRLRRPPETSHDPRYKNDAYWALRGQGYPHSYAKRAFRDQAPILHERQISVDGKECEPDDLLFPIGSTYFELEITLRPILSDESISGLEPRPKEYTVWDQSVRGFGVRVRPSGYKTYVAYYRRRGLTKLFKKTIGRTEDLSLEQARQAAKDCFYKIRQDCECEFD